MLRWIFSPSLFDDELKQVPIVVSRKPLRTTTTTFVPGMVNDQPKAMVSESRVVSDPPPKSQGAIKSFSPSSKRVVRPNTPQSSFIIPDHGYGYGHSQPVLEPFETYVAPFTTPPGFKGQRRSPAIRLNQAAPEFLPQTPSSISLNNIVAPPHARCSSFQPSRELLGLSHVPSPTRLTKAQAVGMKRNPLYRGDLTELDISNATCPPELNCAVRIENISCHATEAEIFSMVIEGKVFSFSKKDPIPGRFPNCAARLVFTTRAAAEAFVARGQSWEGIVLHGHRLKVKWNRDACRPVRDGERHQSRVIRIMGPKNELCAEGVEKIFHTHIKFKLVESKEWIIDENMKMVELSFCSILGQARIAYKFFHEYMECWGLKGFSIGFGPDPCEPAVPPAFPSAFPPTLSPFLGTK